MKKSLSLILIILILAVPIEIIAQSGNIPSPTPNFYVNDYAQVLDDQTEQYILEQSSKLHQLTKSQIVVVTINTLKGQPLEDFSLKILRQWGIGDKQKNNGVLILLVVKERKSRIEVGYGLEGALPDGKTGRIQDEYMIPYYKEGNFSKGILEGYKAILLEVYNEYGIKPGDIKNISPQTPASNTETSKNNSFLTVLIILLILIDVIFFKGRILNFILYVIFSDRKGPRGGGGGFGGDSGGGGSGGGGGSSRSW